ncbi:MAG: sulfur carrier protein ThiS [Syntrophotaleaceae bacterium]
MSTLVFDNESVTFDGEKSIAEVLIANGISPSLVMVRVNGEVVLRDRYETFMVPEGAEVKVYPFVGGG